MDPFFPKRSFGVDCVPQCPPGTVLVRVDTKSIKRAATVSTSVKVTSVVSGDFVGTIIVNAVDTGFNVGDIVVGYVECATRIDVLNGENQEYLCIRSEDIWHISVASAKDFGIDFHARGSGCAIM
ncbi:hypothetical protein FRB94_007903 [Tulasnella sp. JGI-2019a]|nr:hypothetical protein FRB93_002077 [Tulasnella sp. JGI-2019a]KAG8996997.1 hypothetical protein FRB94_007903 [Tulasnella sp. JGI-2019a]KAG9025597.1 hypothetical protein FRB95_009977 [Tulasnella sp. JGI-2019a]